MQVLSDFWEDIRQGFRMLLRDRGFAAMAVAIFALCLGANVALFAVVNAVLLRPLPFPESDQIVSVDNSYPKAGVSDPIGVSVPHYLERRAGIAAFADAAACRGSGETIGEAGAPDRVEGMQVTPSFFSVLKAKPLLGRTFSEDEGVYGKNQVVILSEGLWRDKFAGSSDAIGKTLRVGGGTQLTVIGVMPGEFRYMSSNARLWTPLCFNDDDRKPEQRHANNMGMIARLRPGASVQEAQAQIVAMNEASMEHDPYATVVRGAGFKTTVTGLHDMFTAKMKPVVLLLQAGVLLLLVIGVINLANLYLVRTSARAKDLALRQVLGAGRGRMARQCWIETTALAFVGAVAGLALGWASLKGLDALGAQDLPHTGRFELDATVVGMAVAATFVVGALLALPGILASRRENLALALSVESRGGTTTRAANRLRHGLIVGQIALAFVLLADAGLLVMSFSEVMKVRPGFHVENVISGAVPLPWEHYKEESVTLSFVDRVVADLKTKPGVTSVGVTSCLPFSGSQNVNGISIEGRELKEGETLRAHFTSGVAADYFRALDIPVLEGRAINDDDSSRKDLVCVIDEVVAKIYWPEGGALGHRLINGPDDPKADHFTIVGVVGSVKQNDLTDATSNGAIYFPYSRYVSREPMFVLRTAGAPEMAGPLLRAAVTQADPELPVTDFKTLTERVERSLAGRRSPMFLALIFGGVALLLAALGLYGVLAFTVNQRRREIGVRMALGAAPESILRQFAGIGIRLVGTGVVLGSLGAWFSSRALGSFLFGVGATSWLVYAATALVLGAVAMAACLLPAMRASRVSPVEVLRG